MAVDLVPRKATGAALGIVGLASYAAAGLMNIVSGVLIDGNTEKVNKVVATLTSDGNWCMAERSVDVINFNPAAIFWISAAVISFLLAILNWGRKKQEIV